MSSQIKLLMFVLIFTNYILNATAFDWHAANSASPDTIIEQYSNESVEIKGFTYLRQENTWWLAPQPNIRSCCLSKHMCIMLANNTLDLVENSVTHLQGYLKIQQTSAGEKYLLLDDVQEMPYEGGKNRLHILILAGLFTAICVAAFAIYYRSH